MKFLFLFTGGTIGSTGSGIHISPDASKPRLLLDAYDKRYGIDFEYEISEPYRALSENNTGDTLRILSDAVSSRLQDAYDGIIVTHGTDTLQYSSALLSYTLGLCKLPVVLVSSDHPIEDPSANGLQNLRGAVLFLQKRQGRGVYVSYQNPKEPITIHRGNRLLPYQALSASLYSLEDRIVGFFDENEHYHENPNYHESEDTATLSSAGLSTHADHILRLSPYPGLPAPVLSDQTSLVLQETYHSGTLNTADPQMRSFYLSAKEKGIPVYLTGIHGGISYESTDCYDALGLKALPKLSPIAAFIKLWLISSKDAFDETLLYAPIGGDL